MADKHRKDIQRQSQLGSMWSDSVHRSFQRRVTREDSFGLAGVRAKDIYAEGARLTGDNIQIRREKFKTQINGKTSCVHVSIIGLPLSNTITVFEPQSLYLKHGVKKKLHLRGSSVDMK